jgi:hypothetical protein
MEPFFGFYLSYGIGGKTLMFDNSDMIGGMHTEVVKSFGKDGVNDFDFGLKVGTGVIFYNIYVGLAYEFSTLKIGGNYYRENIIRNGNLSIHLGYNIPLYSKQQLKDSFNRIYPLIE